MIRWRTMTPARTCADKRSSGWRKKQEESSWHDHRAIENDPDTT